MKQHLKLFIAMLAFAACGTYLLAAEPAITAKAGVAPPSGDFADQLQIISRELRGMTPEQVMTIAVKAKAEPYLGTFKVTFREEGRVAKGTWVILDRIDGRKAQMPINVITQFQTWATSAIHASATRAEVHWSDESGMVIRYYFGDGNPAGFDTPFDLAGLKTAMAGKSGTGKTAMTVDPPTN